MSQASAGPIIKDEETCGSWCDDFRNEEGLDNHFNLTCEPGNIGLINTPDATKWVNKSIAVDNGDPFDLFLAKRPSVLKEDGVYKMWYSGFNGRKSRILYATSTDGIEWLKNPAPVINVGPPGAPDDTHLNNPIVMKDDGIYKMWYAGNDSTTDRIMYATSSDGFEWTKHDVIFPDLDVHPNTVMRDGSLYKMWYHQLVGGHHRIFYAVSLNGENWIKKGMALDLGDQDQLDDMHVSGASVLKNDEGRYRMWYSGHDEETGYRIFYAEAIDERTWIKHGMVIDIGKPGTPDDQAASYPFVIKDDDIYRMWYMGTSGDLETQIMHTISPPRFAETGSLVSVTITLPSSQSWSNLEIDKMEPSEDNRIHVTILDGITEEPILGFEKIFESSIDISSIDNNSHPTIKLKATFVGSGDATPILKGWSVTWVLSGDKQITPQGIQLADIPWATVMMAASAGVILFSLAFAGGTEVGKYKFFPVIFPLYSRLKRKELLNLVTRSKIFEYIMEHPGDHYSSIRQELNLNNGVLAYHLKTLEREEYIKSMRDGVYKRFYPVDMDVQRVNGFGTQSIQGQLIIHIINNPGLTQKELSKALGISQQVVSYHLNLLMETGHVRAERRGKVLRYYVKGAVPWGNV
ncbi:MAG: winged helix-turn-helix transcriptional regulator [Thermoplasmata archaeon]|nr:MAG: winged helix-turn-helix transcriptional regulator [Thermoplasmata archaeon]